MSCSCMCIFCFVTISKCFKKKKTIEIKDTFSNQESPNNMLSILQYMSKLHLGVGMPGNIPGMLSHSAAQATAMNAHHCISIAKALVREKHSWPGLGEMETQGAQFNWSIVGSGHICRILTDSWHLCILFVYILVFTDILKWCCKSYL